MDEIDQFGLNEQDVQAPENQTQHEFIEGFVGTTNNENIDAQVATGEIGNAYYLSSEPSSNVIGYNTTTYNGYMENPERAKEINISSLPHGYLLRVGCQSFAFEDHKKMMKYVADYLDNPAEVEKKFYANTLFK